MNQCPETPQSSAYPPGSSTTTRDYYGPCKDNSEVILITLTGMGHVWPGGWGADSWDINASEEVWAFFSQHSLNQSPTGAKGRLHEGAAQQVTLHSHCFSTNLKVEVSSGNVTAIILYNAAGDKVYSFRPSASPHKRELSLPTGNLKKGIYYLHVETAEGRISYSTVKLE
jgi:hypothetical protein